MNPLIIEVTDESYNRYIKSRQINAQAKPQVDHGHAGLIGTQERYG